MEHHQRFWFQNGKSISSLHELAEQLELMSPAEYSRHVNSEKNDFSSWVKNILNDEGLSSQLMTATTAGDAAVIVRQKLQAGEDETANEPLELEPIEAPAESVVEQEKPKIVQMHRPHRFHGLIDFFLGFFVGVLAMAFGMRFLG